MDYVNQLLALVSARDYLALAILVIGWLVQLSRPESKFPITIPPIFGRDPKPLVALLLGTAYGVLVLHKGGASWLLAARDGAGVGLLTMGAFAIVVKFVWNGSPPAWLDALALIFPKKPDEASKPKPPSFPPGIAMLVGVLLAIGAVGVALSGCAWYKANQPALTTIEDEVCVFGAEEAGLTPEASALACKLGVDVVNGILAKKHEKAAGFKRAAAAAHDGGAPKDAGIQ